MKPKSRPRLSVARTARWLYWEILLLLGVLALRLPGDPDMGWHLRNGWDILTRLKFPTGDPYSWTMPQFDWVPHEWGMDILMAVVDRGFGLWGLVIGFAILVAGIFYFSAGIYSRSKLVQATVAVIALSVSWNVVGVRPQMMTLLGLAAVLYLLFRFRDQPNSKLIYWLPAVFLLWANLHGGFAVGFLAIAVFVLGEGIRRILLGNPLRRYPARLLTATMFWQLCWVSSLSVAATLVNPSGWGVYREIYQTLASSEVLNSIAEWLSVTVFHPASYNLIWLTSLLVGLLIANRWQTDITKLVLAVVFFWFGVESWRHIPLFAIAAVPLLTEQIEPWVERALADFSKGWMIHLAVLALSVSVGVTYFRVAVPALSDSSAYAKSFSFPYGAVQYLKHSPGERLLNEYNWGGYLIWQLPEQKVFIDGRMAIWKQGDLAIFQEFKTILGNQREEVLAKLNEWKIDTILTYASHPIGQMLDHQKWEAVFRDDLSVVWRLKTSL